MKITGLILFIIIAQHCYSQSFDTALYTIKYESAEETNKYFTKNPNWRGGDGASSVDLGNGKILWLFGDSFICKDSLQSRKESVLVRNSIAIQEGYDIKTALLTFHVNKVKKKPQDFFRIPGNYWLWPGHGILIKDKLLLFFMREKKVQTGLGFETDGWNSVLISNPHDNPSAWKMTYSKGAQTFGTVAGSAAVFKNEKYMYAYGAVEPGNQAVYLLRWLLTEAYKGNLANPQWWINKQWTERKITDSLPAPLFTGATEYSVHYNPEIKKYVQVQSFGFGEARLGLRLSDSLEGPWTDPYYFYTPDYSGIKKPFMYSAKAHPELIGSGVYITYNINSFDFGELLQNEQIYFPKFISLKIIKKSE